MTLPPMRRWRNEDEEDDGHGRSREDSTSTEGRALLSTCYGMVLVWYHTVP